MEMTFAGGYGAGGAWFFGQLIIFIVYVMVGTPFAIATIREDKRLSFKSLDPIFDRVIRVGLIGALSIAAIVLRILWFRE